MSDTHLKTHTIYSNAWVLAVGSIATKLEFYGPFENAKALRAWCDDNLKDDVETHLIPINDVRPKGEEG